MFAKKPWYSFSDGKLEAIFWRAGDVNPLIENMDNEEINKEIRGLTSPARQSPPQFNSPLAPCGSRRQSPSRKQKTLESQTEQRLSAQISSLLTAVAVIGEATPELAERRSSILTVLAEATGADAGCWSWGRGTPTADTVVPLAIVDFGMNDQQRMGLMSFGTAAEMKDAFHSRVLGRMAGGSYVTTLRQQIYSDEAWTGQGFLQIQMNRCGWNEWLHGIRYSVRDNWSALLFLRNTGSSPFEEMERQLADIALTAIPWLHATGEDSIPRDKLMGLTPRQRTVMFMLLDGQPRKVIAHHLGLSEDTIGDHIKAIYIHLQVRSAVELAALFLRGK